MSWEHNHYTATCDACGHEGVCIKSSDDWGRSATRFEGFENVAPDSYAVGRKRVGADDMRPKCQNCGGASITIGAFFKST